VTYLELVRRVALESGTLPDSAVPATTAGLTGRPALLASWVQQAWRDIQNRRSHWRWMRAEWQGALVAGTQRYTPAALGIVRFGEWVHVDEHGMPVATLYRGDPSDEGRMRMVPWHAFYTRFLRGVSQQDRPGWYSEDGEGRLVVAPVPDGAYTMRGLYRKAPQELAADGDVPEMPARFHDLIVWRALLMLAAYDEAGNQVPMWDMRAREIMSDLERDQLPKVDFPIGTFA
jgi:hypothetical protein